VINQTSANRSVGRTAIYNDVINTRSTAYGTLETIISSSRSSSDEGKGRRKSTPNVLAQQSLSKSFAADSPESQNRSFGQDTVDADAVNNSEGVADTSKVTWRYAHSRRSKSADLTTMFRGTRHDSDGITRNGTFVLPTPAVSEPAEPQMSTATDLIGLPSDSLLLKSSTEILTQTPSSSNGFAVRSTNSPESNLVRSSSFTSSLTLRPSRPSIFGSLTSWFSWSNDSKRWNSNSTIGDDRNDSNAETSLRGLLKGIEGKNTDKGKGVDRNTLD